MERRLRPRKPVTVSVYLSDPGQRARRNVARNRSSNGVFIEADALDFPRHVPLQLFFALQGHDENIVRVHRVSAMVVRAASAGVGMMFCGSARRSRRTTAGERLPRISPERS